MTTLYYIDSNNIPQIADLSIIDGDSGYRYESAILSAMSITTCGNVHRVTDDDDDCGSVIQRAALAAGATLYADNEDAARWWIDYVDGYNATKAECDDLRAELNGMRYGDIRAVVADYLGDDETDPAEMVCRLIESLHDDAGDYDTERGYFAARSDNLRASINRVKRANR